MRTGRRMRWSLYLYFPHSWGNERAGGVRRDEGGAVTATTRQETTTRSSQAARSGRGINRDTEQGHDKDETRTGQGSHHTTVQNDEQTALHEGTDNLHQGGRLATPPIQGSGGPQPCRCWAGHDIIWMIQPVSGHRGPRRDRGGSRGLKASSSIVKHPHASSSKSSPLLLTPATRLAPLS
jgi:hypothetical protein